LLRGRGPDEAQHCSPINFSFSFSFMILEIRIKF
jgi:hypothetical protein